MRNYKKLIKRLVLVLFFIIILICILLINLNKVKEINSQYVAEEELGIIKDENIKDVQNPTMFYTVENIVEKYLEYVHLDYTKEETDEIVRTLAGKYEIFREEQKLNEIMKLLDVKYIEENNITVDNLKNYIKIDNDEVETFSIIKMKVLEEEQFQYYTVKIEVTTGTSNEYNEYYLITLDEYNSTWMIKPINDCNDIDEIQINKNTESINNNNLYSYERVTDAEMAQKYFIKYKQLLLNDTEKAYNRLDEEYRNKRFDNYEGFEKYVNNNKQEIDNLSIDEYLVNEYEDYKEYVCKDKFKNIYKFKTTSIVDYTVELDTYTIITNKFKETYNKADIQNKVMMNVDKWIQMLNNRDYEAAFNVLDETFRNNNFNGDVNVFETFMRNKYPAHYEVQYINFDEQAGGIYTQEIAFSEIGVQSTSERMMTIIMKLEDDMNFVMSFSKDS